MNKRSSFLKVYIIPCFAATFIMAIFLLTFSVNVFAASDSSGEYPYNVPDFRGANNVIPDLAIEMARDRAIDTIQNYYGYTGDVSFILFTNDGIINNYIYDVMVIPMPSVSYNVSPTSNYCENAVFVNANSVPMFRVGVLLDFDHTERNLNAGSGSNLLGASSTSTLNGETFTPRYPFYMYGIDELVAPNGTVIFTNNEPIVPIPVGHATEPDPYDDPVYNTGHAKPTTVPQLTINNYSWTTAPTPDLSTLENTAKSIYNFLTWLASNLLGEFSNLITNLGNIGNYIGSTIQYYGNLIISTIQNGITTFYNNMVSLFEPIADLVNKIGVIAATIVALGSDENGVFSIPVLTQTLFLPDQEDVAEIIAANDSLHIASTIDIFVDKVWVSENSIIKTLHNVTPAKKFHIPSCIYHGVQIGNFDIDFSWFELYKSYSDIVIGSFLAIGWIYWFFVSCSHLLRYGKSYEFENGDGEQQKGIFF